MTLKVTESDLDAYGRMIDRAAGDAQQAKQYLDKYGQIEEAAHGMFPEVFQVHHQVFPDVQGLFETLTRVLNGSGSEIDRSANYYRTTDQDEAARFDALLPEVQR